MTIELTRRTVKDLNQLDPPIRKHTITALQQLADDPELGHRLIGSLRGARALDFSAVDVAYRAAYILYQDRWLVFLIGPHEGFYALAVRRYHTLPR